MGRGLDGGLRYTHKVVGPVNVYISTFLHLFASTTKLWQNQKKNQGPASTVRESVAPFEGPKPRPANSPKGTFTLQPQLIHTHNTTTIDNSTFCPTYAAGLGINIDVICSVHPSSDTAQGFFDVDEIGMGGLCE